jgi:hypothetical protein
MKIKFTETMGANKRCSQWQIGKKMDWASSRGCDDYKTPEALLRIKFGPIISFGSNNYVHETSIAHI